jgi:hypothetical protein
MFRPHSAPVSMQAGGMAQMMPPEAMMPPAMPPGPPPEAMMPPPGPPPAAMPPPTEEEGVATLMTEQGIDPAMMEQMLASASENFGNLDTAEDFEQAMNAIRGDQASVTERRGELAELVGPEDANRTPESVLTLVQPVMMLAEVDQGIGGLAQGEMTEPVTGEMAGGIMSTVDMGVAPEAPTPVNFNQGGAVQRFADPNFRVAGVPDPNLDPNLDPFGELFTSRRDLLRQYVTPSTSAEQLAEQKKLTEAQMLFDLANAGLQLAQPGPPGENFLGAVSRAATDSQLLDKVGARAQAQLEAEKAVSKEEQALDLMAFKSAEDLALALQENDRKMFSLSKGAKLVDSGGNVLVENPDNVDKKVLSIDKSLVEYDPNSGTATVLFTSDRKDIKVVDNSIIVVDPSNNTTETIYESVDKTKPDYRVIRDTTNGLTTLVDITTLDGRNAITLSSAANIQAGTTRFTVGTVPSDRTPTAKAFRIEDVGTMLSYDGGRTYFHEGQIKPMPQDAQPLSDEIAADVARQQRIQLAAGNTLAQMDEDLGFTSKGGTRENPEKLSVSDQSLLRDAMEAAREGTGPYAGFQVFLDKTFGGALPAAREAFQNTQQNRQFLRGLVILGRSALVVNPRFPVAEMEKVAELFPDPDVVFTNPETEASKLIELKNLALAQKRQNLQQLAQGIQDKTVRAAVQANQYEIERLLNLLAGVPVGAVTGTTDQTKIETLRNIVQKSRGESGG